MVNYHGKFDTFNKKNPNNNGEYLFYKTDCNDFNIIFDVGCRTDSIYLDFSGEVHYFDPDSNFIKTISSMKNFNQKCYFN